MFKGVDGVIISEDPNVLLQKLNEVVIRGGGDCPEMSLSGLIAGIENARPNSLVYVLTDATAKDHDKFEEAFNIIKKKQLTVSTKLTIKNCIIKFPILG